MRSNSQRQDTSQTTRLELPCRRRVLSVLISSCRSSCLTSAMGCQRTSLWLTCRTPRNHDSWLTSFVSGYSNYHNFETPIEKLVAYNAGPNFAAKWKAAGAKIADLPAETQKYVQKAAAFLTRKGNDDMAYLGMPSETDPNRTIDGQVISRKRGGIGGDGSTRRSDGRTQHSRRLVL